MKEKWKSTAWLLGLIFCALLVSAAFAVIPLFQTPASSPPSSPSVPTTKPTVEEQMVQEANNYGTKMDEAMKDPQREYFIVMDNNIQVIGLEMEALHNVLFPSATLKPWINQKDGIATVAQRLYSALNFEKVMDLAQPLPYDKTPPDTFTDWAKQFETTRQTMLTQVKELSLYGEAGNIKGAIDYSHELDKTMSEMKSEWQALWQLCQTHHIDTTIHQEWFVFRK